MNSTVEAIIMTLIYLASVFILFFVGKLFYQLVHKSINVKDELVEKDNFAFATAHTGYMLGLLLALGSVMLGPSTIWQEDLVNIFFYGAISIILLNISIFINDKVILRKFSVTKEIVEDRNTGTGVVEAGSAVATGLIIMGAVYGEGSFLTAIVFWFVGQLMLIVATFVYVWITPYDDHDLIEKGNVAVGIGFAGAMVAVGNMVRYALMRDFEGWTETFAEVGIDFAIGIVFIPIARFLADKILLPGRKLTDEIANQEEPNNGAALIEAFAYIGGSVLITWCLG